MLLISNQGSSPAVIKGRADGRLPTLLRLRVKPPNKGDGLCFVQQHGRPRLPASALQGGLKPSAECARVFTTLTGYLLCLMSYPDKSQMSWASCHLPGSSRTCTTPHVSAHLSPSAWESFHLCSTSQNSIHPSRLRDVTFPTFLKTLFTKAHGPRDQHMGLSKQEYWSGLPFPSSEDLPNPGIEPGSPAS